VARKPARILRINPLRTQAGNRSPWFSESHRFIVILGPYLKHTSGFLTIG
jgi:hypothetical protein